MIQFPRAERDARGAKGSHDRFSRGDFLSPRLLGFGRCPAGGSSSSPMISSILGWSGRLPQHESSGHACNGRCLVRAGDSPVGLAGRLAGAVADRAELGVLCHARAGDRGDRSCGRLGRRDGRPSGWPPWRPWSRRACWGRRAVVVRGKSGPCGRNDDRDHAGGGIAGLAGTRLVVVAGLGFVSLDSGSAVHGRPAMPRAWSPCHGIIWADSRRAHAGVSMLFPAVSVVLACSSGLAGSGFAPANHLARTNPHWRPPAWTPRWPSAQAGLRALVLNNLGLDAATAAGQAMFFGALDRNLGVVAAAGIRLEIVAASSGSRGSRPRRRHFRDDLRCSRRRLSAFDGLRTMGWYDAMPELGAVLFAVGWWSGPVASPPPRSGRSAPAALGCPGCHALRRRDGCGPVAAH